MPEIRTTRSVAFSYFDIEEDKYNKWVRCEDVADELEWLIKNKCLIPLNVQTLIKHLRGKE